MFRSTMCMFRIYTLSLVAAAAASLSAQAPQYVQGPRGGCYEVTKTGSKKSVNRSLCAPDAATKKESAASADGKQAPPKTQAGAPATSSAAPAAAPATTKVVKGNRTYVKGPKGGC